MPKPTRYYVEWLDSEGFGTAQEAQHGNADPRDFTHREDFNDIEAARVLKVEKAQNNWAAIYERSNIFDTTPAELRRLGVTWYSADFDEEMIED